MTLTRIAMGVEYDGARFHGFQAQTNSPETQTIQQSLELALSKIAAHPVRVVCAGRTDAGVHALEQVIHFDSTATRSLRAWVLGCNASLPREIKIQWARNVSSDFHARFSATAREYQYVIYNNWTRPALFQNKVTWQCRPLNEVSMQQAAQYWLGQHDFSSFRAAECQAKSPVRTLAKFNIERKRDFVVACISADAFLHHMVRNMMGVLIPIGEGLKDIEWAKTVLEHRDRAKGGITAPPFGLYLNKINYPECFGLPQATHPMMLF